MKLIIVTIDSSDEHALIDELIKGGFIATRMASEGGFFRRKSVTLYIGVEQDKLENALEVIRKCCKSRLASIINYTNYEAGIGMASPYPIRENEGGAVIFVLDIDRFEKV